VLRQLLDRVAAVQQHARVAVDVGDRRAARGGGGEAGVVGEAAGFLRQLRDLDAGGAERATRHRQRDRLVAGIERDLFDRGCFGHLMHSSWPALPGTGWMESAGLAAMQQLSHSAAEPELHARAPAPSLAAFRRWRERRTRGAETTTAALWRPSVRGFARRCARLTSRSACGTCRRGRWCP